MQHPHRSRPRLADLAVVVWAASVVAVAGCWQRLDVDADGATADAVASDSNDTSDSSDVNDGVSDDVLDGTVVPEAESAPDATFDEADDATDEDGPAEDDGDFTILSGGATCDANAHTGDYCAGDKVSGGTAGTLYRCNGPGTATVVRACAAGCVVAPSGQDDYCRQATPTCDATAHTGEYCGGDKVDNANPNTLYHCNGPGPATVVNACANGCFVAPAGQDDACRALAPRCDDNAFSGEYCGGDKVSHGDNGTLYHCEGPGPATVVQDCSGSCTVAPPGVDDFCAAGDTQCAHRALLRWGLAPRASDEFRCAGVAGGSISQTIGNAPASAGYHARDGSISGDPYCAATDLSTHGMTNSQVRALLARLADGGFAAFFRNPGHDGWPSGQARHIHAIYVGVHMKSQLREQVRDWLNGKNGLTSHSTYSFWQANAAQKNAIRSLFNAHN